jgi:hypothetical protein
MRTFWTIVALVLVVGLGIWFYNRSENNLAQQNGNASSTESQNGIGGPDNGFDPLDDSNSADDNSGSYDTTNSKG